MVHGPFAAQLIRTGFPVPLSVLKIPTPGFGTPIANVCS